MVSSTQQTTRIRRRKMATNGKTNKVQRRLSPTPAFPIHLDAPEAAAPAAAKAEPAKKEAAPAKAAPAAAKAEPKKEAAKPAKK